MAAADRMRDLRARRSAGKLLLKRIEVDEVDHVEKLIAGGWLPRSRQDDEQAINDATSRLLAALEVTNIYQR